MAAVAQLQAAFDGGGGRQIVAQPKPLPDTAAAQYNWREFGWRRLQESNYLDQITLPHPVWTDQDIQAAKFDSILVPIAGRVLPKAAREDLSFDYFFMHILAHELSHGIGPQARQALKELYSPIEEAKADITGLFMLQYLFDHARGGSGGNAAAERRLYTTFLASAFRSLRFGLTDAHGKGMAVQFNYLSDKGAFVAHPDGAFAVDYSKIKPAVRDLTHEILTIEAEGNYAGARQMLDSLGVVRPAMQKALDSLKDIPTDIRPVR